MLAKGSQPLRHMGATSSPRRCGSHSHFSSLLSGKRSHGSSHGRRHKILRCVKMATRAGRCLDSGGGSNRGIYPAISAACCGPSSRLLALELSGNCGNNRLLLCNECLGLCRSSARCGGDETKALRSSSGRLTGPHSDPCETCETCEASIAASKVPVVPSGDQALRL